MPLACLPNTAQKTTAYDLALLADALVENHAQYYHYFENKKFSWGRLVYKNHNELAPTYASAACTSLKG